MTSTGSLSDRRWLWVILPVAWLAVALGLPILELLRVSLFSADQGWSEAFIHVATAPLYRRVLVNTVWISLLVVCFTTLIAYPLAYIVGHARERVGSILFVLIIASMWLSLLIRTYAWTVLLQRTGPISGMLASLGLIEQPRSFMYSRLAVVIGMTHIMVPYMVVSILSAAGTRLPQLSLVSKVLGATTVLYFFRVFLPLTVRGAAVGSLLVFLLSLGFYITPELLGGGKGETMMIAVLIDEQISTLGNWPTGAALALLLTGTVFAAAVATYAIPIVRHYVEGLGLEHES